MQKLKFILTSLFFLAAISMTFGQQLEDVVYLKNGSVVRGKILEYRPAENIKIEILGGSVLVYPSTDVVEIKKEASKNPQANTVPDRYIPLRKQKPLHIPGKGWWNYTSNKYMGGIGGFGDVALGIGLYHSFGYQFNRFCKVGLGMGIERNYLYNFMPVYAEFRGDFMKTSTSLFYSLGAGYNAAFKSNTWRLGNMSKAQGGFYLYPSIGIRFKSRSRLHFVMDCGLSIQSAQFTVSQEFWDWNTGELISTSESEMKTTTYRPTIRVGLIF